MKISIMNFKSSKEFTIRRFVIPVLQAYKDLSKYASNGIIARKDLLSQFRKYVILSPQAENRRHINNGDFLWNHFVDLVISAMRDSHILTDFSYKEGLYKPLSEDALDYLERNDNSTIINSVMNSFQNETDIVSAWRENNPKLVVRLIKKGRAA